MAWPPGARTTAHECYLCSGPAWRKCRVCGRWVCQGCRHGAGQWFRCTRCPYEELAKVLRAFREQEKAEHAALEAVAAVVRHIIIPPVRVVFIGSARRRDVRAEPSPFNE